MKALNQVLEQRVHRLARQKVRASTQPGVLLNIIEGEMSSFLTDVLNQKLREEQDQMLQRAYYQRGGDGRKRNGFKFVRLKGLFSAFSLSRPVLRGRTPNSPILQGFKRLGKGLLAMIASRFWLRGCSTDAVAQEINNTFGTSLSKSDISKFTQDILPDVQSWLSRPIPEKIEYLFLDALYLPVRRPAFTTKQALLVAIGIDPDGKSHVLGFLLGDRENSDTWNALLKELLARGLDRNALKLTLSDDHKAIRAAVHDILGVPHQFCIIHKMRNALARVSSKNRKEFYADFKAAFWAPSRDQAMLALGRLQEKWQPVYPKAAQIACADPERFLVFMDQPEKLWTALRSTNIIERFNREIRRRLRPAGAMHSENELWKLLWSVSVEQEKRWHRRKGRVVKEHKELKLAA